MPPKKQGQKPGSKKSGAGGGAQKSGSAVAGGGKKAKVPEKPVAASGTSVYIRGFRMEGKSYPDIRAYFASFGQLNQLRIKRTKKKHGPPYILAFYENANGARKAIERNGATVDGQKIHVEYAKKAKVVPDRSTHCTTLYIAPVSKDTKKKDLITEFQSCGRVRKVRVYAKGHVLVYFADVDTANKAYARYNGGELLSKKVSAKYSVRTVEKDYAKFVAPLLEKKGGATATPQKKSGKKASEKPASSKKPVKTQAPQ
eukprot:248058_1